MIKVWLEPEHLVKSIATKKHCDEKYVATQKYGVAQKLCDEKTLRL